MRTIEEIRTSIAEDYWKDELKGTNTNINSNKHNWGSMIGYMGIDTITYFCDKVAEIYAEQFKNCKS